MKKITVITLIAVLLFSLCGISEASEETALPEIHQIEPDATSELITDDYSAYGFANTLDNPDSKYFKVNDYYNMESEGTLHIISNFETYQQANNYSCGPCSVLMVLNYFGFTGYTEYELCEWLNTHNHDVTLIENIYNLLAKFGFSMDWHTGYDWRFYDENEFEPYIIEAIDNNAPVIVEWIEWFGHWAVIIGIDTCDSENPLDDMLIIANPYDITDHYQDGYTAISLAEFFYNWKESAKTNRKMPYEQPFITVWMPEEEAETAEAAE